MMRRLFHAPMFILPIVMGVVIALLTARVARADDLDPDQIKAALHTTSDIEGGFIDRAVSHGAGRDLAPRPVHQLFLWARKKPRHQFQYFKQALTIRAAEIGIKL